jgi:hypothetical protein
MQRSEVNVGGTAYAFEVSDAGEVTVWRVARAGDTVVGRGRTEWDGTRCRIVDSTDGLSEPVMFAIEQELSGLG